MAALVDANIAARLALAETTPTTMAGLLAVLQFVREQSQDDFLFDGDEESTCFVASIEHAGAACRGPLGTPPGGPFVGNPTNGPSVR
jgi:hypothetical protein